MSEKRRFTGTILGDTGFAAHIGRHLQPFLTRNANFQVRHEEGTHQMPGKQDFVILQAEENQGRIAELITLFPNLILIKNGVDQLQSLAHIMGASEAIPHLGRDTVFITGNDQDVKNTIHIVSVAQRQADVDIIPDDIVASQTLVYTGNLGLVLADILLKI